jgi:hypothetical protein
MRRTIAVSAIFALIVVIAVVAGGSQKTPAAQPDKIELNELEKKFEKDLTGATMRGRFTIEGKEDKIPPEDSYVIEKVEKIDADLWQFNVRIGEKGRGSFPLPVPVKWAGDTPVISVTDMKIPSMGKYTARVVIYRDHYAGTWDAGDHGGSMWGRIEHPAAGEAKEKP